METAFHPDITSLRFILTLQSVTPRVRKYLETDWSCLGNRLTDDTIVLT